MRYINQIVFLPSLFISCLSNAAWTELHQAAFDGNLEQVQHLLDTGADVSATDKYGWTPLHVATKYGRKAIVSLLFERKDLDVNTVDIYCSTPLHWAACHGHEAIVNLFLERGADVNAVSKYGYTPLHLAARNGHKAIAKLLLDRGANVNATNEYGVYAGCTPLHVAERRNHTEVVALLRCWPKYQNLFRKRQEQMFAFLMATHPYVGADLPAKVLPQELFKYIWEFVKPTIEEADNFEEAGPTNKSWLSRFNTILFKKKRR